MSKRQTPQRVCVDTQTIIWGIQQYAKAGQEEMISRAMRLFGMIEAEGHELVIPSIVISELLVGVKTHPKRESTVDYLERNFEILPYDLHCAKVHSQLVERLLSLPAHAENAKKIADDCQITTNAMISNDRKIVATAIANKVDRIFSHDNGIRNNSASMIVVCDLPLIEQQQTLSFTPLLNPPTGTA